MSEEASTTENVEEATEEQQEQSEAHVDKEAKAEEIVKRLTDPKKFTGSHKQRFDSEGKGRGKAGREDLVKKDGYVEGFKREKSKEGGSDEATKEDIVKRLTDPKKFTGSHKQRFDADGKGKGKAGREDVVKYDGYVAGFKREKNSSSEVKEDEVLKRLTDPKKFTGSHKQRFDADGKGKGKSGREDVIKYDGYVEGFKREKTKEDSTSEEHANAVVDRLTNPKNFTGMYKARYRTEKDKPIQDLSDITRPELKASPAKKTSTSTPTKTSTPKKSASSEGGPSVFDRLTDPKKYTGVAKHSPAREKEQQEQNEETP